jgi:hypothetical protein
MITDLAGRDGVWTIPAHDCADDPHKIQLGQWLGSRRPDGSAIVELSVQFSSNVEILTPDEARTVAAAMMAAADYADRCKVVDDE